MQLISKDLCQQSSDMIKASSLLQSTIQLTFPSLQLIPVIVCERGGVMSARNDGGFTKVNLRWHSESWTSSVVDIDWHYWWQTMKNSAHLDHDQLRVSLRRGSAHDWCRRAVRCVAQHSAHICTCCCLSLSCLSPGHTVMNIRLKTWIFLIYFH